jgi:hypothetical protein
MGKAWAAAVVWFRGKKTILGGGLVMAGAAAGVWFGKLDPVTGLTLVGIGLSISGYSAKANRHQAELLAALQGISQAGADVRAGKSGAAELASGVTTLLSPSLAPEVLSSAAASLHLSAPTASELAIALQHLAGNSAWTPPPPVKVGAAQ